jgi:hypothetical protein
VTDPSLLRAGSQRFSRSLDIRRIRRITQLRSALSAQIKQRELTRGIKNHRVADGVGADSRDVRGRWRKEKKVETAVAVPFGCQLSVSQRSVVNTTVVCDHPWTNVW